MTSNMLVRNKERAREKKKKAKAQAKERTKQLGHSVREQNLYEDSVEDLAGVLLLLFPSVLAFPLGV